VSDIPTTEPSAIVAGDTVSWTRSFADFPASQGWALAYKLRNAWDKINISASASGDDFLVSISAATSAAYVVGDYSFDAYATKGSERHTVASGKITVLPNLDTTSAVDDRSFNQRMVDAIEDLLEGRATADVQAYQIGGRQLTKMTVDELEKWRAQYRFRLNREQGKSASIGVRF
jgi:hypothetical protein